MSILVNGLLLIFSYEWVPDIILYTSVLSGTVFNDLAQALGYIECAKAVRTHCKGVSETDIPTNGGIQTVKIIPEGDIYRLVIKSQLPGAEKFESWIFDEVVPSVRKNGGYISGQESLSDDELLANALMVAQNKIAEKDALIQRQQEQMGIHPDVNILSKNYKH